MSSRKKKHAAAMTKREHFLESYKQDGLRALAEQQRSQKESLNKVISKNVEINAEMDPIVTLILLLEERLGRTPTHEELMAFIYGNEIERQLIYNLVSLEDVDATV